MQSIGEFNEDRPHDASRRLHPWRSTVGLKVLMAATGIVLVVFLVFHLLGNLLVYRGRDALNEYSAFLVREPPLLWAARAVLLASAVIHIGAAALLWNRDRFARPVAYRRLRPRSTTVPARTMRLTGVVLAGFIVFHILHLTTGTIAPVPFEKHDVYHNVVEGFRVPWVVAIYLGALAIVGMHVWHGAWASLRSLGRSRPSPRPKRRPVAWILALVLWGGFSSIPLAIWLGGGR
ncbi:succinate dehydrogenase cytochrome b subunit [Myxococcus virescens]|uniref:Succinate dehydrogenase n=1 Tax=Myxococcus virescens TaxID=83456 RepID=A0A511HI35_9BACT|nr:succinate dehydrogenase cytochrome b subunit [Myxococcus virescens]GEL73233.1 succinate dehydrogenase [Myxococcus virescens]SDE56194.1 succinate dehydrogenase / fumarate reductase cytochrome b subunit [Myxococcus virescens]